MAEARCLSRTLPTSTTASPALKLHGGPLHPSTRLTGLYYGQRRPPGPGRNWPLQSWAPDRFVGPAGAAHAAGETLTVEELQAD
jgi:hypothetical protein